MDISDFDFTLPDRLIAQHPPEVRGSSRLLVALPNIRYKTGRSAICLIILRQATF